MTKRLPEGNAAGAKARLFIWPFFGTTEVVPCYKTMARSPIETLA